MIPPRSTLGILMNEHQLILRMIDQMRRKAERLAAGEELDPRFVEVAVDFIRSYADRAHHGKEEAILFRELAARQMRDADTAAMQQLIDDHVRARAMTHELVVASEAYFKGAAVEKAHVVAVVRQLCDFYPGHIAREDREFFRRAMTYFDPSERAELDAECREFDRMLIHERYRSVVDGLESQQPRSTE